MEVHARIQTKQKSCKHGMVFPRSETVLMHMVQVLSEASEVPLPPANMVSMVTTGCILMSGHPNT